MSEKTTEQLVEEAVLVLTHDRDYYKRVTARLTAPSFTGEWVYIARRLYLCDPELCREFSGRGEPSLTRRVRLYTALMEYYFPDETKPEPQSIAVETKPKEIKEMTVKIENKTFVNGVDVKSMKEEDFLKHVTDLKAEIERLQALASVANSTRLGKTLAKRTQEMNDLVALYDSLDA